MIVRLSSYARHCVQLLSPAYLGGFTFSDWIKLLHGYGWQVDWEYLPRAMIATSGTMLTSLIHTLERRIALESTEERFEDRPLFILGLARSGTTHLFELLARDPQFCFPTRFDCYNPHTFLSLRRLGILRLLSLLRSSRRYMDNVSVGWQSPAEDAIALAVLMLGGNRIGIIFPRTHGDDRKRLSDPLSSSPQPLDFVSALTLFTRKLVHLHRRQPLYKSPDHMLSIAEICRAFPDARFVTILRNPCEQFASLLAMYRSPAAGWGALQRPPTYTDESCFKYISVVLGRYLATRTLIPPGQILEIKYHNLVSDSASTLESIYRGLGLTMPDDFRNQTPSTYERNCHPELTTEVKNRLREIYQPAVRAGLFDAEELM